MSFEGARIESAWREEGRQPAQPAQDGLRGAGGTTEIPPAIPEAPGGAELEADDTVPVEKLAEWLHREFDSSAALSELLSWAQERESVKDLYRAGARKLLADLPELFR